MARRESAFQTGVQSGCGAAAAIVLVPLALIGGCLIGNRMMEEPHDRQPEPTYQSTMDDVPGPYGDYSTPADP